MLAVLLAVLAYLWNVFVAVDILLMAIFWPGGKPGQSISARIGHSMLTGGWASLVPWPQWWITHCIVEAREFDAQLPPS